MPSQVTNGKAFEWVVAIVGAELLNGVAPTTDAARRGKGYFDSLTEKAQNRMSVSARLALEHLISLERLQSGSLTSISIQEDEVGQLGDVRDVIFNFGSREIGISCKNNHSALKHSRLSDSIDFVQKWDLSESGCSQAYWDQVLPVFQDLREMQTRGVLWNHIPLDQKKRIYWTILDAFASELKRVVELEDPRLSERLITYLIGRQDFYKIISRPKTVEVYGFNFFGTLGCSRAKPPRAIVGIDNLNGGQYSKTVRFTGGFTVNFRIHNASSRVEPSLKFDIKAISWPEGLHKFQPG
jgi:hypothetical protein